MLGLSVEKQGEEVVFDDTKGLTVVVKGDEKEVSRWVGVEGLVLGGVSLWSFFSEVRTGSEGG